MARSSSSGRWLREHRRDPFVQEARRGGHRSRAVFKLQELDEREGLLRPGRTVLDLGAAPGGWSRYAARRVSPGGRVIALDLLPMEPLAGVELIEGDFREEAVLRRLLDCLGGTRADVVLSDMAPNMSGSRAVDQPRAMHLAELALELCGEALAPGGDLLVKVFQGEGFPAYQQALRRVFGRVSTRKPRASRARSAEVYLLGRRYGL